MSALALLLLVAAPPSVTELRAQATRAFREKRFDVACPLFEQAVKLAPTHAATLADYGLCLARQGRTADALRVDREALRHATGERSAAVRRNVYFNLARLEAPPETPSGCTRRFARLETTTSSAGTGGGVEWTTVRLAHDTGALASEALADQGDEPIADGVHDGGVLVLHTRFQEFVLGGACHPWAVWDCAASPSMEAARRACARDGGSGAEACFEAACADAWRQRSLPDLTAALDACVAAAAKDLRSWSCRVVHEDACAGLVGVVCGAQVSEYTLPR
ncbi:MAG: tetratricopeptide repeat protein [Myxococcota bacterium]